MRQPHKGASGRHIPHSGLRLQARGSRPRACVAEETWGRASPGQLKGFPVTNNCVCYISERAQVEKACWTDPNGQSSTGVTRPRFQVWLCLNRQHQPFPCLSFQD